MKIGQSVGFFFFSFLRHSFIKKKTTLYGQKKLFFDQKIILTEQEKKIFWSKTNIGSKNYFLPIGDRLQRQRLCQKFGKEGLSNNDL